MAQKAIREYDAKRLLFQCWQQYFPKFNYSFQSVLVHKGEDLKEESSKKEWLKETGLVVKPDMLFGKRGLNKLVYLQDKKSWRCGCVFSL